MNNRMDVNGRAKTALVLLVWLFGISAIGVGTGVLVDLAYALNGQNINAALSVSGGFAAAIIAAIAALTKKLRQK